MPPQRPPALPPQALHCGTRSPDPPGSAPCPGSIPTPARDGDRGGGMLQGEVTRSNVPRQESPGDLAFGTTGSGRVPGQVMPCSPSGHEQRLGAMHKPLPQPKEQSAAGSGDRRPSGGQGTPTHPCTPRARTHAGCTARCPETASTRGNIHCRSPRSRRGAPRGACATDGRLRPPCPEPPGQRAKVPGELLRPAGSPPPREREDRGTHRSGHDVPTATPSWAAEHSMDPGGETGTWNRGAV